MLLSQLSLIPGPVSGREFTKCRAGLKEREAPGKIVTARALKRLVQLSSASHTLVST